MLAFVAAGSVLPRAGTLPCVNNIHRAWSVQRKPRRGHSQVKSCATPAQPTAETDAAVGYQDDGTRVVPVQLFIRGTQEETVAGVYGVLDGDRELVYVGMNRDVAQGLSAHIESHGEDDIQFVKVMTFAMPKAPEMQMVVDSWIMDNETIPKGNLENWVESDTELAYQASLLETVEPESPETIISPFETNEVDTTQPTEILDLSVDNVDLVLNEVRPYLISDGGNVSVLSIDPEMRKVELQLEGACGSCASATMTMQMGIEKALRAKFGDNIGEVVAVSAGDSGSSELTTAACEAVLDEVRGALRGLGGSVQVLDVDEGEVIVSFAGPNNLKYGIELMLKEKMPGVEAVTFE